MFRCACERCTNRSAYKYHVLMQGFQCAKYTIITTLYNFASADSAKYSRLTRVSMAAENKSTLAECENKRLNILLNLHKARALKPTTESENLPPSSHNTWMSTTAKNSAASSSSSSSSSISKAGSKRTSLSSHLAQRTSTSTRVKKVAKREHMSENVELSDIDEDSSDVPHENISGPPVAVPAVGAQLHTQPENDSESMVDSPERTSQGTATETQRYSEGDSNMQIDKHNISTTTEEEDTPAGTKHVEKSTDKLPKEVSVRSRRKTRQLTDVCGSENSDVKKSTSMCSDEKVTALCEFDPYPESDNDIKMSTEQESDSDSGQDDETARRKEGEHASIQIQKIVSKVMEEVSVAAQAEREPHDSADGSGVASDSDEHDSAVDEGMDTEEEAPRRRRASSVGVSYAEPNLSKKLRQVV
jgi:hypothetical protein